MGGRPIEARGIMISGVMAGEDKKFIESSAASHGNNYQNVIANNLRNAFCKCLCRGHLTCLAFMAW